MGEITNNSIQDFLFGKVYHFQGVFSSNNIPESVANQKYFSLICNHAKLGHPGTHFVTIIGFPKIVIYIDTFGRPCKIKDIVIFLKMTGRPIHYNKKQIQSFLSNFCGFYCIMYVLYFEKVFNNKKIGQITFDSVNMINNDDVCLNEINNLVK